MNDKLILTIAYGVVAAFGWWLVLDVEGVFATAAGIALILFGGLGLAGMARFGPK
jgi:hypothetical protein